MERHIGTPLQIFLACEIELIVQPMCVTYMSRTAVGFTLLRRPTNDATWHEIAMLVLWLSVCTACALRAYCARRG